MELTTTRVVEPIQRSQRLSFRELVEENKRFVYYLARDLTGNHHDAEDLSQEVFIKAHKGLDGLRRDGNARAWLSRIAVHTYLNKRRKKALAFMQLRASFDDAPVGDVARLQPDEHTEAGRIQRHIETALKSLSPKERSAFVLRHYHEQSINEVAQQMELAEGTIKTLLFRAVRKLRKHLDFYRNDLGLS